MHPYILTAQHLLTDRDGPSYLSVLKVMVTWGWGRERGLARMRDKEALGDVGNSLYPDCGGYTIYKYVKFIYLNVYLQ